MKGPLRTKLHDFILIYLLWVSNWQFPLKKFFFVIFFLQLNQQQNQSAKGATTQDYSFLKEASPIYVTSLANHVSGTTTLTTSNLSSSNYNTSAQPNAVQTHQVHVHQPPQPVISQQPLAGGWLIGESAKGQLISNDQQIFQNILNNNNNSNNNFGVNSAGGTVVYSGINNSCISSTGATATNTALNVSSLSSASTAAATGDSSNLAKYYGNSAAAGATGISSELIANGHGPRREV